MNPNKVDLEKADELYMKLRDRKNLTRPEITRLIKMVDEVKFVVNSGKLGPQGHKAAVSIYTKLSSLENKHRVKAEVKKAGGLFAE